MCLTQPDLDTYAEACARLKEQSELLQQKLGEKEAFLDARNPPAFAAVQASLPTCSVPGTLCFNRRTQAVVAAQPKLVIRRMRFDEVCLVQKAESKDSMQRGADLLKRCCRTKGNTAWKDWRCSMEVPFLALVNTDIALMLQSQCTQANTSVDVHAGAHA